MYLLNCQISNNEGRIEAKPERVIFEQCITILATGIVTFYL